MPLFDSTLSGNSVGWIWKPTMAIAMSKRNLQACSNDDFIMNFYRLIAGKASAMNMLFSSRFTDLEEHR